MTLGPSSVYRRRTFSYSSFLSLSLSLSPVVLLVEYRVRPEGLRDIFVKVGWEREVRVEVIDETAVVGLPKDEQHVVVPDHKFLLFMIDSQSVTGT
jgi:hypothetical protein